MLDTNLLLFSNDAFDGASAVGTAVSIGRTGLPTGSQIVAIVQNPETTEGVLTVTVELSLDGTNYIDTVAVLKLGTDAVGFCGQRAVDCHREFAWERYTGSNIKLRATVVDGDNDGASAWGKVRVYVGAGEPTIYGRAPGVADDIAYD